MFQHLTGTVTVRTAAVVPTTENTDFTPFDTRGGTCIFVVNIAARTTGNVTVGLRGSYDGGATYETLKTTAALAANGVEYIQVVGPLPPLLRLSLVPAASFDGTVGLQLRTGGAVAAIAS